ncbi:MAG TPA: sigma-70 family RNA polymerase sigma factor [Pirellulales bacterium]|nr:sigma-70 family RNA polymerase sigma factor [Pirellulales bacterium]
MMICSGSSDLLGKTQCFRGELSPLSRRPMCGVTVNDDLQLIDETLQGNSSAFGRLVTRYQDRLYNTLVHVTGSAEDGRDVCQDAFVQAFIKLRSFQRSSAFYTWLYRIALNMAASRRRRKKPTLSVYEHREATGYEPIGRVDPPSEPLEQQERAARVQEALATLDDDFRTVLVLREIDGHSYEAIAQMLDLPLGTVRSRLHRARMELRELLKGVLVTQ